MKNTIKLDNPVQINGKSYDELTYDISEITAQAFAEADARKLSASGSKNGNAAGAAELSLLHSGRNCRWKQMPPYCC